MHVLVYHLFNIFTVMGKGHNIHAVIRGQLVGISSLLLPCVVQNWTQKAPLPAEPPGQPTPYVQIETFCPSKSHSVMMSQQQD